MFAGKYIRKTFSLARSSLVMPLWLANEICLQLQAYWASEGFQQESSKNKANRAANPTASSTMYRGESSSVGMHKRKLEVELGRPPKQMEVFKRCYKKKEDGGWSGPRAAVVAASVVMTEQQIWLAAIGGKNKGHVFGLGSEAHFSSRDIHTATSEPGTGGPYRPPRGDDGRHDGYDPGDADQLLHCWAVTADRLQYRPSTAYVDPQPSYDDEMGGLD
ncbi:UNVERIFIED_CONTAM: hypothetical protein Slati_4594200 [Sesamum latifolium]|uniref:Uncharacterized protein n=1 Tax=Sesamum latifolium TaxID=2727402 RepID=A0AAW2S392_9LAMI